jgi:pimeloyl-ACP methyl ester carboxylesterase
MTTGSYAKLGNLEMYYEVHGNGRPLVLVHGGFGTVAAFGDLVPALASARQVVAVELQGHGHTADVERPFSFEQLADDIAKLIRHLGQESADLMGYSLGGGVVQQTAIRHPTLVSRLVVVSAPHKSAGWYPEVRAGMRSMSGESAKAMVGSPMHQAYVRVAPEPANWTALAAKTGDLLRRDYDWSSSISTLKAPTLIVLGDGDSISPAVAAEFFALLGGGKQDAGWDGAGMPKARLAILPGTTHYNICSSPLLPGLVKAFLDAPVPSAA